MEKRICARCVMDESAGEISFDENGYCNFCGDAVNLKDKIWKPSEETLEKFFSDLKERNAEKKYDCLIGISGGIDSSYLAYLCNRFGVRMLGVHIDAGWDTEVSCRNIETLRRRLNLDLVTLDIDRAEMMDLQRAYFRAEVINQDVPQDHAFFASLYQFAIKNDLKDFLSGGNFASESILPASWGYNSNDSRNLKDIHKKFGSVKLKTYPKMSFFDYYFKFPLFDLKKHRPLNMVDYDKEKAIKVLQDEIGFEYYGSKHCESSFTRLYQGYILPEKFGVDKRRCHLSSLIVAGQLDRETALNELSRPLCSAEQIEADIDNFIKSIDITREEFDANIARKGGVSHYRFKTQKTALYIKDIIKRILNK